MARIGTKLRQNAFRTISDISFFDAEKKFSAKFLDGYFCFLLIWRGFWRATTIRTSKSAAASNLAQDRLILKSVRPKMVTKQRFAVPYESPTTTEIAIYRNGDTELVGFWRLFSDYFSYRI